MSADLIARVALLGLAVLSSAPGVAAAVGTDTQPPYADQAAWQAADEASRRELNERLDVRIREAETRSAELAAQIERNAATLDQARGALDEEAGELAALFATVRQVASDAAGLRRESLLAAQLGPGQTLADRTAGAGYMPSIGDLKALQQQLLEDIREAGRVVRFDASVVSTNGLEQSAQVVRVGAFSLVSDGYFLAWDPATETLQTLVKQPRARHRALAAAIAAANAGVVPMAVDPTMGAMLDMLARQPSLVERVQQGGVIGYVILALGAAGLGLALWRLVAVAITASRMRRQLQSATADSGNPLGRVLRVYDENPDADAQLLELCLDEAILQETPRLERWQGAIKAIAAVAPLLGLLGTVTGMIETFQTITLSGSSDPRLMAGGISQALITTVLGLTVAIPLVLLHTALAGRSRALVEVLEAQSAGIIARRAQRPQ